MRIVISNVKGGVGKTTSAVYIAAMAAARGNEAVTLVDADRQASAAEWLEERPVEGVDLLEAPSERTVTRAMDHKDGVVVVDTPPGDERVVRAALERADAIVIPTRAGGVEPTRVVSTLEMIRSGTPAGVVVCAARLGTFDLAETVRIWRAEKLPVWVVPERVGIATGPEGRLSREGMDAYGEIYRWARRKGRP